MLIMALRTVHHSGSYGGLDIIRRPCSGRLRLDERGSRINLEVLIAGERFEHTTTPY